MRRPPIACCRAVPSSRSAALEHVWISDDLLAQAAARFFRTTCPHQRRHGSNVPGPLEARRRAAKRKMTLQASMDFAGHMPPPWFDLGSLFARRPREPNWKYEPPSLRRDEPVDSGKDNLGTIAFGQPAPELRARDEPVIHRRGRSLREALNSTEAADSRPEPKQTRAVPLTNDRIVDFVNQHFIPTDKGTVGVKNMYLRNEEPDARPIAEQSRSIETADPMEDWARDTAQGHAQLFELLSAEAGLDETTESISFDAEVCFEKFRGRIAGTAPDMFDVKDHDESRGMDQEARWQAWRERISRDRPRPGVFLTNAYLTCCPPSVEAGKFCVLVLEYLVNSPWKDYAIGTLGQKCVSLPNIFEPEGLRFLELLKDTYLAPSVPRTAATHFLYKRLGSQVQSQSAPTTLSQEARARVLMSGTLLDRDQVLQLLISGLWDSAHYSMRSGQLSEYIQTQRIRVEDRKGNASANSAGVLLHWASYELSDQQLARKLRKTWSSLITNYHKAPLTLMDAIYECAEKQNRTKVPVTLDYLHMIPRSLLRTWIGAMSVAANEVQTVPQIGNKKLAYVHTWFQLFYRLDMRRNASTSGDDSMCQFAFDRYARAHFQHRYRPAALVIGLLYSLLGHASFPGKLSRELHDWIESYVLFLAQEDERGVSLNGMLAKLMFELRNKSLPNHGVLELLIPYIEEYKSFHSVSNLLERMSKSGTTLSDTAFLENFTDEVVSRVSKEENSSTAGYNAAALKRFLAAQHAIATTTAEPRVRTHEIQERRFFNHILARAKDAHIVPLAYRNLTPDIPKDVQGDLIHQFAQQYALDRTRSCQQNWRSIRYLYLYLKIHEIPIYPSFTRTVVNVCIARPLRENRFVAQMKAVWVCRLVARVEGEHVARQVEKYFWAQRGDLILRAKHELLGLGSYEDAHISTMARLGLLPWGRATPELQEVASGYGRGDEHVE